MNGVTKASSSRRFNPFESQLSKIFNNNTSVVTACNRVAPQLLTALQFLPKSQSTQPEVRREMAGAAGKGRRLDLLLAVR